jgi:UrcA family protein
MSRSILLGAAAAVALTAAVPLVPAIAQGDADRADTSAITVYSPYRETTKRTAGMTERTLVASTAVYFDDLNLHTQWGRDQLDDRIKLAAETTCENLDSIYPNDHSATGEFDCVRKAVRDTRPQVYAAVVNYVSSY